MKKYEYIAISRPQLSIAETLNEYSKDGWRVIQSHTNIKPNYTEWFVLMEREIIESNETPD